MEQYYEKNLIINNRELKYKGIFRTEELFHTINRALDNRGYEKREKKTEELVTEEGKRTFVELRPLKVKTNFTALMIVIKISLDNVSEIIHEVHGRQEKLQRGDIAMIFDAWVLTDYQQRWGMKPMVYFLKGFINKYLYKFPMEAAFPKEVAEDTAYIYAQIRKLLASYAEEEKGRKVSETEIMRSMEEEMKKNAEE